jgi:hypothetical protein
MSMSVTRLGCCERLHATTSRTLHAVVFANHLSGFLPYCYGINKYERIQILGFGCEIGLCVSAAAGGRNGVKLVVYYESMKRKLI